MRSVLSAALAFALFACGNAAVAQPGDEPSRPLTPRALANLEAFAALFGDVRFFHPSDQAATADWEALAIAGVQRVEGAVDAPALAKGMGAVFGPVAPTLRVFPAGAPAPAADPALGACGGEVIEWLHRGVRLLPGQSAYSDVRTSAAGRRMEVIPLELGGGVSALLPVTVCRGAAHATLPAGEALALKPDKPDGFRPSGNDRTTRLADVVLLWSVLQQFYPYFDVGGVDWKDELTRGLRAAATDKDDAAFAATLSRMVAALRDGHGNVYYGERRALPLSWTLVEGRLVVTAVQSVASGGLVRGDEVIRIGGRDVKAAIAALEPLVSGATPQWRQVKTLQRLAEAPTAVETVSVEAVHADGRRFTTQVSTIAPSAASRLPQPLLPEPIATLKPGIVYVDLSRFTRALMAEHQAEVLAARALVLDMRGYPSADARMLFPQLSDHVIHSARFEVPVRTRPNQTDVRYDASGSWELTPRAPRVAGKLVMLVGPSAISYAESLAGIFEGERLGVIVGEATAGTNGNVVAFALPGGYRGLFTGMRVEKRDGSRHHGVGIVPNVIVQPTLAGIRAGRDEVLEAGVAEAERGAQHASPG